MKVLIVCSHRYYAPYTGYVAPFIYEQMEELKKLGCVFEVFFIKGGGTKAYLKAIHGLRKAISRFAPDIVHAHYGLCGVVANTQRRVPVVTTYHGSDINVRKNRLFSKFSIWSSRINIFVSNRQYEVAGRPERSKVIACGIDTEIYHTMNKLKRSSCDRRSFEDRVVRSIAQ